jgi:hypothetical protein
VTPLDDPVAEIPLETDADDPAKDGPAAVRATAATVAKTTLRPVEDLKFLRVNICNTLYDGPGPLRPFRKTTTTFTSGSSSRALADPRQIVAVIPRSDCLG